MSFPSIVPKNYIDSTRWNLKLDSVSAGVVKGTQEAVEKASDFILKETIKNVSGPAIGEKGGNHPAVGTMPVPQRSRKLRESIKRKVITKTHHAIYADPRKAPHATHVHNGTKRTKPRRFLGLVLMMYEIKIREMMEIEVINEIRKWGKV